MDALTQAEVFALIGELNGFIEKWDPRLVTQEVTVKSPGA